MAKNGILEVLWNTSTTQQVVARLGIMIPIAAAFGKDALEQMSWSNPTQAIVTGLMTLGLALLVSDSASSIVDQRRYRFIYIIIFAYAWMTLLYTLSATGVFVIPAGFDAVTDMIGTLVFLAAWLAVPSASPRGRASMDGVLIVVLGFFVFVSGGVKVALQLQPYNEASYQAARLMLNLCNGIVLLGLYGAMREVWGIPDPTVHAIIMLFGGAQIAAAGRDCLSETGAERCGTDTAQGLVAYAIVWILIGGKILFALYAAYCFSYKDEKKEEEPAPLEAATI